jgi:transposase-like protein
MYKPINKEIKQEVLAKANQGEKVSSLAKQYGISTRTIYDWLSRSVAPQISWTKYQRLKRENEELKRIIGLITLDLEKEKKRRVSASRQ